MSKKLGALVKEARTESGLTQAALAKKIKSLTASDISKIERGEKEPDKETLKEMAKVLGVTQASLVNAASGKTAAAKTSGTAKKTAASKTSGTAKKTTASKTGKSTTADLKLTAAEKKLVQLYRKADADTKKTAVGILDGSVSVKDLLMAFVRAKSGSTSKPSSGIQDLLGSLLGGDTGQSSNTDSEASSLGSLLEGLLGKR